jgi:hypothetical protein
MLFQQILYSQLKKRGGLKPKGIDRLVVKVLLTGSISFVFGFLSAKVINEIWGDRKAIMEKLSSKFNVADIHPPGGGPF